MFLEAVFLNNNLLLLIAVLVRVMQANAHHALDLVAPRFNALLPQSALLRPHVLVLSAHLR
jgi:hypothetical protein